MAVIELRQGCVYFLAEFVDDGLSAPSIGSIVHEGSNNQEARARSSRYSSSLKRKWIGNHWHRTRQEAIADVREYVAVYYNFESLQSTLGYTAPMNYEKRLNKVSGNC